MKFGSREFVGNFGNLVPGIGTQILGSKGLEVHGACGGGRVDISDSGRQRATCTHIKH